MYENNQGGQSGAPQYGTAPQPMPPKKNTGLYVLVTIVVIVILGALVWMFFGAVPTETEEGGPVPTDATGAPVGGVSGDTTSEIDAGLQGLKLTDPEGEFKGIDSDVNQL